MGWTSICKSAELTEGQGKYAEIGGFQLAVFLHQGKVYAMDNRCPHVGGNLAGGHVDDGCAVCPWHGWAFRLDTGQLKDAAAVLIDTYPVRILARPGELDLVQVDLPMP